MVEYGPPRIPGSALKSPSIMTFEVEGGSDCCVDLVQGLSKDVSAAGGGWQIYREDEEGR